MINNEIVFEKKHHYLTILQEADELENQIRNGVVNNDAVEEMKMVLSAKVFAFAGLVKEGVVDEIQEVQNGNETIVLLNLDGKKYECDAALVGRVLHGGVSAVPQLDILGFGEDNPQEPMRIEKDESVKEPAKEQETKKETNTEKNGNKPQESAVEPKKSLNTKTKPTSLSDESDESDSFDLLFGTPEINDTSKSNETTAPPDFVIREEQENDSFDNDIFYESSEEAEPDPGDRVSLFDDEDEDENIKTSMQEENPAAKESDGDRNTFTREVAVYNDEMCYDMHKISLTDKKKTLEISLFVFPLNMVDTQRRTPIIICASYQIGKTKKYEIRVSDAEGEASVAIKGHEFTVIGDFRRGEFRSRIKTEAEGELVTKKNRPKESVKYGHAFIKAQDLNIHVFPADASGRYFVYIQDDEGNEIHYMDKEEESFEVFEQEYYVSSHWDSDVFCVSLVSGDEESVGDDAEDPNDDFEDDEDCEDDSGEKDNNSNLSNTSKLSKSSKKQDKTDMKKKQTKETDKKEAEESPDLLKLILGNAMFLAVVTLLYILLFG